jgi:hypothetical protein
MMRFRSERHSTAGEQKMKDILETMRAELDEAIELMRPRFPNDDEDTLRIRAETWRPYRYRKGHWPDFGEVAKLNPDLSLRQQEEALDQRQQELTDQAA